MSSSESRTVELLASIPLYLHLYAGIGLYAIGNAGNLLTLLVLLKRTWRKNVCVVYFLICLVANTVFINSSLLGSILNNGFSIAVHNSSALLCKFFYYIAYLTSMYYPVILVLASIDRLLISSQNVDTRLYSSKRLASFSIALSTIICCFYCLHILIKVDIREVYPTVNLCYYEIGTWYLSFFVYSSLAISAAIPLCLVILSVLSFKNVSRIRAGPRQHRRAIRPMTKKDFQLLRCLYIHNVVYVLFSILIVVAVGYSLTLNFATAAAAQIALNDFLSDVGSLLHAVPYATSFLIFVGVSRAFRTELKRMLFKICRKDLTAIRDEDHLQHNDVIATIELTVPMK